MLGFIASSLLGPQVLKVDMKPPVTLLVVNVPIASPGNEIVESGWDLRYSPSPDEMNAPCY